MASYGLRDIYLMGRGGPSNDINGGGFTNYLPRQRGAGMAGQVNTGGMGGSVGSGNVSMSPWAGPGGSIREPQQFGIDIGRRGGAPGGSRFTNAPPRINDPRLSGPYGRPPMQRRPPSNIGW